MSTDKNAFRAPNLDESNSQKREAVPVTVYAKSGQAARISIDIVIGDANDVIGTEAQGGTDSITRQTFQLVPIEPPRPGEGDPESFLMSDTPDSDTPDSDTPDSDTPDSDTPDFAFPDEA